MSPQDQFKLLVDFNQNGYINTDPKFYIGEAQAVYQTLNLPLSG